MYGEKLKNQESVWVLKLSKSSLNRFLQRFTSAIKRTVTHSEVREILIKSLDFENANSEYKRMISPLKIIPATIEEWIRNMVDIWSHYYVAALIKVISKRFEKNWKIVCFNCDNQRHL